MSIQIIYRQRSYGRNTACARTVPYGVVEVEADRCKRREVLGDAVELKRAGVRRLGRGAVEHIELEDLKW